MDHADPHARERALELVQHNPPSGLSPASTSVAVPEILESKGDTCPECAPEFNYGIAKSALRKMNLPFSSSVLEVDARPLSPEKRYHPWLH
jgi:hypothetical protein